MAEIYTLATLTTKDFNTWHASYIAHESARKANGVEEQYISKDINDPNVAHVLFKIHDKEKAKAFLLSPEFAKVHTDAGVIKRDFKILQSLPQQLTFLQ